ncbi:MAG: hypothetical protein DMG79_02010, partial [Acidobacteria bacterium]
VGEKSEPEVQESIRRWWALIHPADRPIAQKYLLMVLGRSASALGSNAPCQANAHAGADGERKFHPNRRLAPKSEGSRQ